ncbi:hypothetical protein Taro_000843 [Colocasia esculenta]|uniref:Uncharacterized protein n=1 Tax=Colocasia esculenta TaxID=4460 RepID=A0A843TE40_COLES|nr:hypothetical protein [Colocasia esculenta]
MAIPNVFTNHPSSRARHRAALPAQLSRNSPCSPAALPSAQLPISPRRRRRPTLRGCAPAARGSPP